MLCCHVLSLSLTDDRCLQIVSMFLYKFSGFFWLCQFHIQFLNGLKTLNVGDELLVKSLDIFVVQRGCTWNVKWAFAGNCSLRLSPVKLSTCRSTYLHEKLMDLEAVFVLNHEVAYRYKDHQRWYLAVLDNMALILEPVVLLLHLVQRIECNWSLPLYAICVPNGDFGVDVVLLKGKKTSQ